MADTGMHMSNSKKKNSVKLKYTTFVSSDNSKSAKNGEQDISLQEAFKKYRKAKQKQLKQARRLRRRNELRKADPKVMSALRRKFIQQAKKYFGYPYAKKYWPPDSQEYHSKLFLDCCGLVRQVMRDLADDFGFMIGPWNQAYMYDTLPITVKEEEMRPGDLVFVSATYFNPKSKKQPHNMTHVEIWLGDGPKTIGARWNNGKVQVFDSYRFNAKSYYDETYHFKSIDTWLKGICRSHCSQHLWKRRKFNPRKKSVFSIDQQQTSDQNNQQDQAAGDDEDDITNFIVRGNSFYSETNPKAKRASPSSQQNDADDQKSSSASSISTESPIVDAVTPDILDEKNELLIKDGGAKDDAVDEGEVMSDVDNSDDESASDDMDETDMDFIDAGDADDDDDDDNNGVVDQQRPICTQPDESNGNNDKNSQGKSGNLVDLDNRGIYLRDLLDNVEAKSPTSESVIDDHTSNNEVSDDVNASVDACSICQHENERDESDQTEKAGKVNGNENAQNEEELKKANNANEEVLADISSTASNDIVENIQELSIGDVPQSVDIVSNNTLNDNAQQPCINDESQQSCIDDLQDVNQNALRKEKQDQPDSRAATSTRLSPDTSASDISNISSSTGKKSAQSTGSEDSLAGSLSTASFQEDTKGAC